MQVQVALEVRVGRVVRVRAVARRLWLEPVLGPAAQLRYVPAEAMRSHRVPDAVGEARSQRNRP